MIAHCLDNVSLNDNQISSSKTEKKKPNLCLLPYHSEKILVNRGWVPKNQISSAARQEGQPSGVIEFTGIVRKHENRPQFMPKMPEKGRYFAYRDVNRMSRMTGAEPYLVDATTQAQVPGGPIGGQTMITVRNEHLSYIFTWFSLSGLTGYFWYRLVYLIPK